MMAGGRLLLAAGMGMLGAPVVADETFTGRWAADLRACAAEAVLIVGAQSLHWRDAACTIRTSYRVRDVWHIGARCLADGAVAGVPVKLQRLGERLMVNWAGAAPEELQRCR